MAKRTWAFLAALHTGQKHQKSCESAYEKLWINNLQLFRILLSAHT